MRLICRINRNEPDVGTADMAYYCFALAVARNKIRELEFRVSGKKPEKFSLEAEGFLKKTQ